MNANHEEITRLHRIMESGRAYLNTFDNPDLDMEIMATLIRCNKHGLHTIFSQNSDYLPYRQAKGFENWLEHNMKLYIAGKVNANVDELHLVIEK